MALNDLLLLQKQSKGGSHRCSGYPLALLLWQPPTRRGQHEKELSSLLLVRLLCFVVAGVLTSPNGAVILLAQLSQLVCTCVHVCQVEQVALSKC